MPPEDPAVEAQIQQRLNALVGPAKRKLREELRAEIEAELRAELGLDRDDPERPDYRALLEEAQRETEALTAAREASRLRWRTTLAESKLRLAAQLAGFHDPDVILPCRPGARGV